MNFDVNHGTRAMMFQRLGACYTENTNTMRYALLLVVLAIRPIAQAEVEILSIEVLRETPDEVDLELKYRLSGTRENTRAGAMTMFRGRSTGHWAYRSAKLEPGTHRAVITIGRNADAPEIYFSDSFDITIGGGVHHKQAFAFEKVWCVDPGTCGPEARAELKRAAGAPLAERLTTVQPSIRIMAEEEAKALDEDAKRALLPDLVNQLHDGDVPVRLTTLRAIEALDVRDPVLTTPLVKAMADPHPGVSRSDLCSREARRPDGRLGRIGARERGAVERCIDKTLRRGGPARHSRRPPPRGTRGRRSATGE